MADVIFAGGCFWCTEAVFQQVAGVSAVESGYMGGHTEDPDYRSVCSGQTGHAEAVRIDYDPDIVDWDDLADIFFATHDPTQLNRQGNDVGTQYRSTIFVSNDDEREAAARAVERAQADWSDPIVTTVEDRGTWYPAEVYHQDYWQGDGQRNPYCLATIPPKLQKLRKGFSQRLKGD